MYDDLLDRVLEDQGINMLVPWYLMAGVAYERYDESLLSDPRWDKLCQHLDEEWSNVKHRHKRFIKRDALTSATASYLFRKVLPNRVIGATVSLISKRG